MSNPFIGETEKHVVPGGLESGLLAQGTRAVALEKQVITSQTQAIMPVHLNGHPCKTDAILAITHRHNLNVIEDAVQVSGADDYHPQLCQSILDVIIVEVNRL